MSVIKYRTLKFLHVDIALHSFFEAPTIAQLATVIEGTNRTKKVQQITPFQSRERGQLLPLSFNQERRMLLSQLLKNQGLPPIVRNVFNAFHIEGHIEFSALHKSINCLVERHAILRTFFSFVDDQPTQFIQDLLELRIKVVDIQSLPESVKKTEVARIAQIEANNPFHLHNCPPIRLLLIQLDREIYVLIVVLDHIVADGWSIGILIRELCSLYNAFFQGLPSPLADLPIQFIDYIYWQKEWAKGKALEELSVYWRKIFKFSSFFRLDLPFRHEYPVNPLSSSNTCTVELSEHISQSLQVLCQRKRITMFIAFLATLSVVLHKYTGMPDVGIFSPVAHRDFPETANLIGWLAGQLYLRCDLAGDPTLAEVIERVRKTFIDAYTHKDITGSLLMDIANETLGIDQGASVFPMMFFDYDDGQSDSLELINLTTRPFEVTTTVATVGLSLFAYRQDKTIKLRLVYGVDSYKVYDMQRMLRDFQRVLESICLAVDQHLSELHL